MSLASTSFAQLALKSSVELKITAITPFKVIQVMFKVIDFGFNRKLICDFLSMNNITSYLAPFLSDCRLLFKSLVLTRGTFFRTSE